MAKKVLFNLLLSVFLFAFLFAATVFGQADSCGLKIEITPYGRETKITGATATAVNSETKRVYKSVLRSGMPYFAKLPQGEYRITATKAGYMRSVDDFVHSCSGDDDLSSIELYKGSSAKIVKLYNRTRVLKAPPLRRSEVYTISTEPGSGGTGVVVRSDKEDLPSPIKDPEPTPVPKVISGGVVNGKATKLVKPVYPPAARAVRASGAVNVQVTIDENGNVISASAVSGHPLLRAAAVQAARESKFAPTLLEGQPVKVTGVIVFNFVP